MTPEYFFAKPYLRRQKVAGRWQRRARKLAQRINGPWPWWVNAGAAGAALLMALLEWRLA